MNKQGAPRSHCSELRERNRTVQCMEWNWNGEQLIMAISSLKLFYYLYYLQLKVRSTYHEQAVSFLVSSYTCDCFSRLACMRCFSSLQPLPLQDFSSVPNFSSVPIQGLNTTVAIYNMVEVSKFVENSLSLLALERQTEVSNSVESSCTQIDVKKLEFRGLCLQKLKVPEKENTLHQLYYICNLIHTTIIHSLNV